MLDVTFRWSCNIAGMARLLRTSDNNPFEPGFGDARVWVPRVPQTSTARSMIRRAVTGSRQAPRLIEQERGYGKTSLLAAVTDHAREEADRPVLVRLAAVEGEPFTVAFAYRLAQAARELAGPAEAAAGAVVDALARIRQVRLAGVLDLRVGPEGAGGDAPPSIALEEALLALGRAARRDGDRPVVILVDEAQAIDRQSRRAVFNALQTAINTTDDHGRVLPFAVLLAGLPGTRAAFKRHQVTFGERCRDLPLERLEDEAVRETLWRFEDFNDLGIRFAADAIEAMVGAAGGHPHVFQLVGEGAWNATPDGDRITTGDVAVGLEASRKERAAIVAARLSGLTDTQLNWLTAAATIDDEHRTLTAVCRRFRDSPDATAAHCGSIAAALFDKGLIRRSDDGRRVAFALAGMREHLAG